jgi:hypothetical protein
MYDSKVVQVAEVVNLAVQYIGISIYSIALPLKVSLGLLPISVS